MFSSSFSEFAYIKLSLIRHDLICSIIFECKRTHNNCAKFCKVNSSIAFTDLLTQYKLGDENFLELQR